MGLFDGIEKAKAGDFNYFKPGDYKVRIEKYFTQMSKKKQGITQVVLAAEILEAKTTFDVPANEVGTIQSQVTMMMSAPALVDVNSQMTAFQGRLREMGVLADLGLVDGPLTEEEANKFLEKDGERVKGLELWVRITPGEGKFTRNRWFAEDIM